MNITKNTPVTTKDRLFIINLSDELVNINMLFERIEKETECIADHYFGNTFNDPNSNCFDMVESQNAYNKARICSDITADYVNQLSIALQGLTEYVESKHVEARELESQKPESREGV